MLRIFGIGESFMAEELAYLIDNGKNPTVAPYAKGVDVSLRITAKGETEEECLKLIKPVEEEVRKKLKEKVYGEGEITLEHKVAEMLCKSNLTIAYSDKITAFGSINIYSFMISRSTSGWSNSFTKRAIYFCITVEMAK